MYYCRGSVATATPWGMPTMDKIRSWTAQMQPHFDQYTPVVVGRCLYDIGATKDFDVMFTGPVGDPTALRNLLNLSISVGFELDMLVDPKWAGSTDTARYDNAQVKIATTPFIFLDYYEEDDGLGNRAFRDFTKNPKYTVVSPGLVSSTFAQVTTRLKPHQVDHLQRHGCFMHKPLADFIKGN